jgi:hypothetical protein
MKYGLIFLCSLSFLSLKGQNCANYQKRFECFDKYKVKEFLYSGQSTSITFNIKENYQTNIVLYGNRDYLISFCVERKYAPVHFKIINSTTNELIYDNQSDNYSTSVGFTLETTSNFTIECSVLANGVNPANFEENRGCLGVLILYKTTPRTGFKGK